MSLPMHDCQNVEFCIPFLNEPTITIEKDVNTRNFKNILWVRF